MTSISEKDFKRFVGRIAKGNRTTSSPRAVEMISEKPWQQDVKWLAQLLGWKTYHTLRSKGSDPDFPDLVLARRRRIAFIGSIEFVESDSKDPTDSKNAIAGFKTRVIVAELKIEGEEPTAGQQEWLNFFKDIGAETYVWRPSDLEWVQKVLR